MAKNITNKEKNDEKYKKIIKAEEDVINKMKNPVRVIISGPKNINITRSDICKKIMETFPKIDFTIINKLKSKSNHFIISIVEDKMKKEILNTKVEWSDLKVVGNIVDPFEYDIYRTFRVVGCLSMREDKIFRVFNKDNMEVSVQPEKNKITVNDITREFETGNYKVTIKCSNKYRNELDKFPTGIIELDDITSHIIRGGERMRCLICNSDKHLKNKCNVQCATCKEKGHATKDCNMARRLDQKQKNKKVEDFSQDEDDQEENEDDEKEEEEKDKKRERDEDSPEKFDIKKKKQINSDDENDDIADREETFQVQKKSDKPVNIMLQNLDTINKNSKEKNVLPQRRGTNQRK